MVKEPTRDRDGGGALSADGGLGALRPEAYPSVSGGRGARARVERTISRSIVCWLLACWRASGRRAAMVGEANRERESSGALMEEGIY